MPALRFLNTLLLLFPALLCIASIATAAEQTYVREYIYQASEADSKISAKAIALQEVKRELLSELGTHVSSLVKMQSASDGTKLNTEEIETLSAGVTRVEILNEKWDGVTYVLKAQIKADPADVLKSLEKMLDADKKQKQVSQLEGNVSQLRMQNINASESLTQAKKETTAALAEIARLKKQLEKQQTDAARQTLQTEYREQVDALTSNEWFESGWAYYQKGDYANAFRSFKKAAEQGKAKAQYNLGIAYTNGQGVTQDHVQAVAWTRKAAEQGFANAQFNLGLMYENGQGVTQDHVQAVAWTRKAAEQGHANAQFNLGVMYDDGQGVTQDYVQAVAWTRKAAEQGDAYAQFNLGVSYSNGQGVAQDYVLAVAWTRKAAEQGHADAQFNLGIMYYKGLGVTQDYVLAVAWTRKAAEQGDAGAQANLGDSYDKGQGVAQDYVQAYAWFNIAAIAGNASAMKNRDITLRYMTAIQREAAQKLSQEYLRKYAAKTQ